MSQGHRHSGWQTEGSNAVNKSPGTFNYPDRIRKRKAWLERKFGSTITKYNHGGSKSSSCNGTRPLLTPRECARRDIAAMGKTVEIADGSGDFDRLMIDAFGKGYKRYWKFARDVFRESTGLRLIEEAD